MIEVIKQGSLPTERIHTGTCHYCKSELRWKAKDGTDKFCQRDGSWNEVKCPLCAKTVIGFINDHAR
jgi:endogenous inhibitor of DNA gyrase (YacG/DUF329 family)